MKKYLLLFYLFLNITGLHAQAGMIFFNYPQIHSIYINFYEPAYYDSLTYYKAQSDQTGIDKYIGADVIIDNDTLTNIGVRFRGNSSYNHPGTKKPVQLDFNEFVSGQKYDGMKKLNLNNSYLDPTQMREKLMLDMLNETGIPAPRMTYANVYFNGGLVGLYKASETINKEFLQTYYSNNDGNLFKCEPNSPLSWEGSDQTAYYDNAELKTNETINDWSDLIDFIYTINFSGNNFENNIRNEFNVDTYIKSWAANMVFGNLDAYFYLPHNYYLYHDTITDKFEWITWDVSLAFGVYALLVVPKSIDFDILYLPNNGQNDRPLNYYILNNNSLKAQYLSEICTLLKNQFLPQKLFPKIDSLANVIRPSVMNEPSGNQMFTLSEFESNLEYTNINFQLIGQVPGLKDFISRRRSSLTSQLCKLNWSCTLNQQINGDNIVAIYPNPGEEINIEMIAPNEFYTSGFTIYDITGRIVKTWSTSSVSGIQLITFNDLSAGTYVLKMESGCSTTDKKFIVIK